MSKERNLGKRLTHAGLRVGAALLAAQMSFGMDRTAHADINEPVRYPLADGRLLADAPLRTAGRAVDFTGPRGLEFCGAITTEPTVLTVVAQEDLMNIKVIGNPDVFVDPEDLNGTDYPSRAAAAVEALQSKATELINRTNRLWRRIAVILTRDAVNQNVCDLITDSGAFAAEAAPQAPAVVAAPPVVQFVPPAGPRVEFVPTPAPAAPAVRVETAGAQCPPQVTSLGNRWDLLDANRRKIGAVFGVNLNLRPEGVDKADHDIFKNVFLPALRHVLGDPGAAPATRALIIAREPQNLATWDANVATGMAEYLEDGRNLFNVTAPGDFRLTLPPHVILRGDFEELCATLISQSRKIGIEMDQYSPGPGGQSHYTLILRSPFFEASEWTAYKPTLGGTQFQIAGLRVARPTAFYSESAFLDGVGERQARPNYPNYVVVGIESNSTAVGIAQSQGQGRPFVSIGATY